MIALQERVCHGYAHALEDLALGLVLVAHVVVPVRGGRLALDLDGPPIHEDALGISLQRREMERGETSGTEARARGGRAPAPSWWRRKCLGRGNGRGQRAAHLIQLARVRRAHAHEDLDVVLGAAARRQRRTLEELVLELSHRVCLSGAA